MITIPIFFWRAMLSRFAAAPKRVEQVGYFDGYELGDHGVVTTTTIPEARLERRTRGFTRSDERSRKTSEATGPSEACADPHAPGNLGRAF